MRPAKNFAQNKMLAFQLEKLYISFLEVPETYSKEISLEKNKTKLDLILDENANGQEFFPI